MKITDAKMKRILNKDYSHVRIKKNQEWYVGRGIYLSTKGTKEHLLNVMEICKSAVKSAQILKKTIDEELGEYRITNNLYGNVLDLSGILYVIKIYAEEYIRIYQQIEIIEDELRAAYFGYEIDENEEDELPF